MCFKHLICMTTDSDGCHVGYLYDNQQWRLQYGLFGKRKVQYHFSVLKVIPQKTKFNIEYLFFFLQLFAIFLHRPKDNQTAVMTMLYDLTTIAAFIGFPNYWKHHTIAKGCPEDISSVVEVSSCSNQKTFCQKFGFFRT